MKKAKQDILIAVAEAYLRRGAYTQYDQRSMDRVLELTPRRRKYLPPESANSQYIQFLDCSGYTSAIYLQAFNYLLPSDLTWHMVEHLQTRVEEQEAQLQHLRPMEQELTHLQREHAETLRELAHLREENRQLRGRVEAMQPSADAYEELKERTAGVELEAHRRAQSVEARAKIMAGDLQRQMEQWAARTEEQYAALKGQIDSSVEQANKEILAASQSLAAMTQLVEQQQAALHAVAETYVLNVRGKKAE